MYDVFAHGGIGFSPFGIDNNGQGETPTETAERLAPFAQEYKMAAPMMRELAEWGFEGKIKAVVEQEDHAKQTIDLGAWQATVLFGGDGRANAAPDYTKEAGKLMIVKLDENKFMVMGTRCHITFRPVGGHSDKAWQYLKVEEGSYQNGVFTPLVSYLEWR